MQLDGNACKRQGRSRTYAFPCNCWMIFLTDELTNDRYLVNTRALFHVHQVPAHLVPFIKEQMGYLSPHGDSSQKLSSFKAKFLLPVFC
jgi:hypothetical protein